MVYQEYKVSYMNRNDEWKLPLNLAIGFHIMVALSAIYLPHLFDSKPQFTDIYTVNLINMAEPAAAPAPAAPTPPQPAVKTPPKVIEKAAAPVKIPVKPAAPIAEEKPAEIAPPAPLKAISLKPLKRKIKNKIVPPDDTVQRETEKREKEVERQKRQQLADTLKDEQATAEDARIAEEEADAARKEMEATQQQLSQIRSQSSSGTGTARSSAAQNSGTDELGKIYAGRVATHIQPLFQLPEIKTFDPSLVTVVNITINSNGEIADIQIETGSGDSLFDQFVLKSIEASNPLPPIPPALRKQRFNLGLRMNQSGIQ